MAELKKGARITGGERSKLAADLKRKYTSGSSIRSLAAETGRPYGFALDPRGVRRDAARPRRRDPRQEVLTSAPGTPTGLRPASTWRDGALAVVTLTRADKRNAQTPAMWRALVAIGDQLLADDEVLVCCCGPRARRSPPGWTGRCSRPASTASRG